MTTRHPEGPAARYERRGAPIVLLTLVGLGVGRYISSWRERWM